MTARASKARCASCGNRSRKRVRAVVLRDASPPRIGLVCQHCAACGVLVVPPVLQVLEARPRRVSRGMLADAVQRAAKGFRDAAKERT